MKSTSTAGEFLNSQQYRIENSYDVRPQNGLVVIRMDNGSAVVTKAQWEKACAMRVSWDDSDAGPGEDLDAVWDRLMSHDIASTPRGMKAIAADKLGKSATNVG